MIDHDTGRLVWAHQAWGRKTLKAFFTALGESRYVAITHVSADAAQWIADEVAALPPAVRCADASTSSPGPWTCRTRSGVTPGTRPGAAG